MMNKKVWPILLLITGGVLFWAFKDKKPDEDLVAKQQKLLVAIGQILEEKHYSPKKLDDNFSKLVFNEYIKNIDPGKDILLQTDMKALNKYQTLIDDEIQGKVRMQFFIDAGTAYAKRLNEVIADYSEALSKPFDFTKDETMSVDEDNETFTKDEAGQKEQWYKRAKYLTLERFVDLQNQREAANGKDTSVNKTDAQLEAKARQLVKAALDRNYTRQKLMFTQEQQYSSFVNAITSLMDPHTNYFAPIEKRAFEEDMSGRFYGIGAQLKDENGAVKIASLVTGSPAFKSGQVQVNDEIIKVAQGAAEPVDVAGYAVTDVVKLIRGAKGTEVRLTFKKSDGTTQVVSLIRDEIVQDETYARSTIITENGKRTGYIYLPEFYTDMERQDGNRCSEDVAQELRKLKTEKVDGVILDLRNNGGGSLYEVVQMVGLFIKGGPVVQVKSRDGQTSTLSDDDNSVLYEGPLAVMVNEFSASASEIFAAAIQDYKRGIIIGSTSTYGKATVQRSIPLGKADYTTGQPEFGALKLTFQKFYRVSGASTQLKGVVPDIVLPDAYEYLKLREKDEPSALPWDQIKESKFTPEAVSPQWQDIISKANNRINSSQTFSIIKSNTQWLSTNLDKTVYLNIDRYKSQQDTVKKTVKQNEVLYKLAQPMDIQPLIADKSKFYDNPDKAKGERYQQWVKGLKTDIYIYETVHVVNDMAANNVNTAKQ